MYRIPMSASAASNGPTPNSLYNESRSPSIANDLGDGSWSLGVSLSPPTASQLYNLTTLPAGLANRPARSRRPRDRGVRLVRDGQIVSQTFDVYGRRPQPTNGLSLEQSIQMEFTSVTPTVISSVATVGALSFAGVSFSLSQFAGSTAAATLFDQYRIEQIECWLEFPAPNGTSAFPELMSAVDLDDANVPTSTSQVIDHQGSLVATGPGGHYHKFKPHIALAAYSGAFTSYSNTVGAWIDSASPNVQHFGLKLATVSSGGAFAINLVTRAVVSFRAPLHG